MTKAPRQPRPCQCLSTDGPALAQGLADDQGATPAAIMPTYRHRRALPVNMLKETATYSTIGLSLAGDWLANVWTQPYSGLVANVWQPRLYVVGRRLDATVFLLLANVWLYHLYLVCQRLGAILFPNWRPTFGDTVCNWLANVWTQPSSVRSRNKYYANASWNLSLRIRMELEQYIRPPELAPHHR